MLYFNLQNTFCKILLIFLPLFYGRTLCNGIFAYSGICSGTFEGFERHETVASLLDSLSLSLALAGWLFSGVHRVLHDNLNARRRRDAHVAESEPGARIPQEHVAGSFVHRLCVRRRSSRVCRQHRFGRRRPAVQGQRRQR